MKPETACGKIINESFVQIIHLLNNSERTVGSDQGILMKEIKRGMKKILRKRKKSNFCQIPEGIILRDG